MRRITLALLATTMIAGTASAADLSSRRYAPVQAPTAYAFNWTGFYLGGNVGYGWGTNDWTAPSWSAGKLNTDFDGFVGGGQLGFNYQMGNIVLGLQGDISGSNLEGKVYGFDGEELKNEATWLASITARVGYAVDRALFYVKGGAAWTDLDSTFVDGAGDVWKKSKTRDGWTVGAGVEYAFAPNWTTFVEYDYYDFGNKNTEFGGDLYKVDTDVSVVKVGVNYRFGY
ncbi:outer membrane protein [Blastochloris viridis]|uniref:Outer membrane protein A n=1 Tax=Blastochloris viridis TaxID=1079 RepID=A0A0H5B7C9_BLAVI|nr:outer membrane protein [Blastochloris viridis]ALK08633.1 outer membrane protein A [Blastochloris viridis]BAR98075.1 outer-membrane immunogenic protein precursor [Blastochloris viridis]CUU41296.1 outer membrane protein A [Blastochloris viridis]